MAVSVTGPRAVHELGGPVIPGNIDDPRTEMNKTNVFIIIHRQNCKFTSQSVYP